MITKDTLSILLLTTKFALPRGAELKPFKTSEWNRLTSLINDSEIKTPSALFQKSVQELITLLKISENQAKKISDLLAFGGQAALALEELERKGMWVLSRADPEYPQNIKNRLKGKSPPIFFGAGDKYFLNQPGAAMVGSRSVTKEDEEFAAAIASHVSRSGKIIISGGAKGIDTISVNAAIASREYAVAILPNGLSQFIKKSEYRQKLESGDMAAISAYLPSSGFSVGAAMGRNKYIYTQSDYTFVIKSDLEKGGTWAGATEAIKNKWVPVFVRPGFEGNDALIKKGGIAIDDKVIGNKGDFQKWIDARVTQWHKKNATTKTKFIQQTLI